MECKERLHLTEAYVGAFKRQQWISERLKALRTAGDPRAIGMGEKQEEAAIEETYEAWAAMNRHECTGRCEQV